MVHKQLRSSERHSDSRLHARAVGVGAKTVTCMFDTGMKHESTVRVVARPEFGAGVRAPIHLTKGVFALFVPPRPGPPGRAILELDSRTRDDGLGATVEDADALSRGGIDDLVTTTTTDQDDIDP